MAHHRATGTGGRRPCNAITIAVHHTGMKKDSRHDPVDHYRTTQPHTGVAFRSRVALPAFVLLAVCVIVLVTALASAGHMQPQLAGALLIAALVIGMAATAVMVGERRRVNRNEALWLAKQSDDASS